MDRKAIIDSIERSSVLAEYSKKLRTNPHLYAKFAEVLINSSLAEYYCQLLIEKLCQHLENKNQSKVKININQIVENRKTNLESALNKLQFFEYPHKQRFESIVLIIKEARNEYFHNMIIGATIGKRLDVKRTVIQDQTELLRAILTKIMEILIGC